MVMMVMAMIMIVCMVVIVVVMMVMRMGMGHTVMGVGMFVNAFMIVVHHSVVSFLCFAHRGAFCYIIPDNLQFVTPRERFSVALVLLYFL